MADFKVNRRLKGLIEEHYNISPVEFAKRYNDPKAVKTYNIISERNGVSNKMLDIIIEAYPEISRTWLLTGEGEKLKDQESFNVVKEDIAEYGSKESLLATIQNLSEALNRISKENKELKKLLDQNKKALTVPMEDAGCADVG